KKNKFNLDKPVKDLPDRAINLILYGTETVPGTPENDMADVNMDAEDTIYNPEEYEGVVNMIRRWFGSSNTSDGLRAWVEKFMLLKPCPVCEGKRLKKESLWFKIDEKNIGELSELDLDKLLNWFESLEKRLNSRQNVIARDILKE